MTDKDRRTDEVLAKIDMVADRLGATADRLEDAISRFNKIAPSVERILKEQR